MAEKMVTITLTGFTPKGYEIALQVIDCPHSKLQPTIAWFDEIAKGAGVRPVAGQIAPNGKVEATDEELPNCPIHNCAMERHDKGNAHWYSHKLEDGSWCRGKPPKA